MLPFREHSLHIAVGETSPRRMTIIRGWVAVVTAGMLITSTGPAFASSGSARIDDGFEAALIVLLDRNPGTTRDEMIEAATVVATESGQVMREVIVAAAREAEAQELPEGGDGTRLGVGADIVIPASNFKGDVFYSPVSTLGVTHGHSGIFSTLQTIVEAPGPGKQVRNTNRSNVKVASGSHQQVVNTTQAKRDKAVTKALTFVGRAYNLNFAFNKTANGAMNCSQVVWVAYKDGSGIDLDANGGNGVYPIDIKNSSHTSTYRIVK